MDNGPQAEMPKYKCFKEVYALKIEEIETDEINLGYKIKPAEKGFAPISISKEWFDKHNPEVGGYYVVYKDGYKSYSPAKAFEEGYELIK